jgi:hypothetical protein
VREQEHKLGLIRSKRTAIIAVVLTGLVAAMSFHAVFSHQERPSTWLLSLPFLPVLAVSVINLALYAYFLWLCVLFFREALAKERVLVAGWFFVILLSPIQRLVSRYSSVAIQYAKAVGISVAFIAAVLILIKWRSPRESIP